MNCDNAVFVEIIDACETSRRYINIEENIIVSCRASRVESSMDAFRFNNYPGIDIRNGMVLVCDTGRYNIKGIVKLTDKYIEITTERVQ